jgi:ADP-heptose:LPS heptosyltransferase
VSVAPQRVAPRVEQVRPRPEVVRAPGTRFPDVRGIVVVRTDRLGDVILTLPAVDALRRAYPDARLALMVAPAVAPLGRLVGGLDAVLEADERPAVTGRRLAEFGCDLVVCVSRDARSAWAAFRAGIRHRVGTGRRWFSCLFHRRVAESRRGGLYHECEYALSFAHRAGASPGPVRFDLRLPPSTLDAVDGWLAERGVGGRFVVVHPGSGGSCPRWPKESFAELVARLAQAGVDCVVSLGPGETFTGGVGTGSRTRSVPFDGQIPELAALLARASLVVGNSSGPVHLAAALGRPVLALHAPWTSCGPSRWGPYDPRGWAIVAPAGAVERRAARRRRPAGDRPLAGIPVEDVLARARSLLAGREPVLSRPRA